MNLYIGNLHFEVSENDLTQLFEEFGTLSSLKLITDRESGRSRGFGFVEYDNNADALKAIQALSGKSLRGRNITIREALPRA